MTPFSLYYDRQYFTAYPSTAYTHPITIPHVNDDISTTPQKQPTQQQHTLNDTEKLLQQIFDAEGIKYDYYPPNDDNDNLGIYYAKVDENHLRFVATNSLLHISASLFIISKWETEKLSKITETINEVNSYCLSTFCWEEQDDDNIRFYICKGMPFSDGINDVSGYLKWTLSFVDRGAFAFFSLLKEKGVEV